MADNDSTPTETALPDYFGHKAVLIGQTRPLGSPPIMAGFEIIADDRPTEWRPPAEENS